MALATPKRLAGASPAHARSKVQEAKVAKRIGGAVTKGSGSGDERGDVRLRGVVRVECKTTKNRTFSVTPEIIHKLNAATFGTGEIPVLEVELELGRLKCYVLPDWAMDLLLDAAKGRGGTDR